MSSVHGVAIAIDGPAGSGKSTVGLELAKRLGYRFVDTGLMYRAVTRAALEEGVPWEEAPLSRLARELEFSWAPGVSQEPLQSIRHGERAVSKSLNTPEVDRLVSRVSVFQGVRRELVRQQRQLAAEGGLVMVGRDIGTVVLPDARLKVYLDASPAERARRRRAELQEKGEPANYRSVLTELKQRDKLDSERPVSPLRPAADAQHIDTDGLEIEQVIERICALLAAA